jgi:hypothetical protein
VIEEADWEGAEDERARLVNVFSWGAILRHHAGSELSSQVFSSASSMSSVVES